MNLKDALREADGKRGVKLEGGEEWLYGTVGCFYLYTTPDSEMWNAEEDNSARVEIGVCGAIREDWIVEPLPEPEKMYSLSIRAVFPGHGDISTPLASKAAILEAVKKWAEEA